MTVLRRDRSVPSGLDFPQHRPEAYPALQDEPAFDAARHLALGRPERVWQLADLGYDSAEIAAAPSKVAITTPFRLLSDEGVAAFRQVALRLGEGRRTSNRTASYVPGSVYRSRFVRDFCNAPEVTRHMSEIAGCPLVAHSMPSQQAYINFAPEDLSRAVDTWHSDSIGLDYVLMLSDPRQLEGGVFQFFLGTRRDAAAFLETRVEGLVDATARDLPLERIVSLPFPAAGYAVFQQGSHVIHRATALTRRGERITVVPGLVTTSLDCIDPTRDGIAGWGEPAIEAEFARHKAWLARNKLDRLIGSLGQGPLPEDLSAALRAAVSDAEQAAQVLEALAARQKKTA
ncbi:MAG TPA: hypothetical protein VJL84_01895 [Kiloniellales bacterium]|nr:hypothetical protein [Kiloniellales bacterium]